MKAEPDNPPRRITALLEDVLGCKWSWAVLRAVHGGATRPGQLERAIPGISTKVLNERLRKMVAYGVFVKTHYPEVPPRVEYAFTDLGKSFFAVLEQIEALERGASQGDAPAEVPRRRRAAAAPRLK